MGSLPLCETVLPLPDQQPSKVCPHPIRRAHRGGTNLASTDSKRKQMGHETSAPGRSSREREPRVQGWGACSTQ